MSSMTPISTQHRTGQVIVNGLVALALIHAAWVLLADLPRTPLVKRCIAPGQPAAAVVARLRVLNTIRAVAPGGNVFLSFSVPPERAEVAELFYYNWTYAIYPRRVVIADESRVINSGRDLIGLTPDPPAGELRSRGVTTRAQVWTDAAGRINMNVNPVECTDQ